MRTNLCGLLAPFLVLTATSPLIGALLPARADIEWSRAFGPALERAKEESRVVFIAINMDGERANDRLAEDVYTDKAIVKLTEGTVNLVASTGSHGDRRCSRFHDVACGDHQAIDIRVRHDVLKSGDAPVVAPQHVFLGPDGSILLSVPYEVRAGELEWCFHEAWRQVDPDYDGKRSKDVQRPKRLVVGGVQAGGGDGPMPREAALELIRELRKGWERKHEILWKLTAADEPEARDEIQQFLRAGPQMNRDGTIGEDQRAELLRHIGETSPTSFWELAADYVGAGEESLRREAIVALEQLATPEGLAPLMKQLRKEKDARIEADILRAVGACGGSDGKARSTLLKAAASKRDELQRRNAIVALGWLEPDEDVHEFLAEAIAGEDELDRAAAAVAMGLSRDGRWIEVLEALGEDTPLVIQNAASAALDVLRGEGYVRLQGSIQRVAGGDIPRARLFSTR